MKSPTDTNNTAGSDCQERLVRHWDMFAQDYGNERWMHFGSKRYADMHGGSEPTVPVRLTEDPDGAYHGWIETGEDTPSMIWPSRAQLTMCFAYGVQVEIDKGRGVPIRLRCESLPNNAISKTPEI
jgi:hypothetical protein